jgi:RNA polymerase sigma-70 factor, ECF subfamily
MLLVNNNPLEQTIRIPITGDFPCDKVIDDTAVLVRLIQSNSERGFHLLYDKYSAALYGVIMKFVRRSDIADDLLQDTFVKIWKNIQQFDPAKGTLFTWMLNIARNLAIDYMRSSCHKIQSLCADIDVFALHSKYLGKAASHANEIEFKDFKAEALSQLNPKYTEVLDMILFYGYTHEQTAKALNLPLGTVKTRVKKGFEMLKTLYLT